MIHTMRYSSPLGELLLAARDGGLVGLWLPGQKYFLGSLKGPMEERRDDPALGSVRAWLDRYFAGERPDTGALPLAPEGSAFRRAVWQALREIPYGALTTYGALSKTVAARLGRDTMSPQAVGGAVGHNPISIIIPCHRVVGAGGSLTGYAGGLDKKLWLLEHEGADTGSLFVPADSPAP